MYRPAILRMKDFQSFAEEEYIFQAGSAFSIEGENMTDDGQKSNGSGKSAFADAIYYLLLGTSSTGKKDGELVRWGQPCAELYLKLEKTSGGALEIMRKIYSAKSKSAEISIIIDGKDAHDRYSSVMEGNRLILELLGLSADDLRTYFLVSRERFVSFFDSPDSAKRNLLARFSSVDKLKTLQGKLQEEWDSVNELKSEQASTVTAANARISVYKEQEASIKKPDVEEIRRSYEERISQIDKESASIEDQYNNTEEKCNDYRAQAEVYTRAVRRFESLDYSEALRKVDRKLEAYDRKRRSLIDESNSIMDEISDLRTESAPLKTAVAGAVECPSCGFRFNPSSNIDVSDAKALLEETEAAVTEMKKSYESKLADARKVIESYEFKELKSYKDNLLNRRGVCNNKILSYKRLASDIQLQASTLNTRLSTLNERTARLAVERETLKAKMAYAENDESWLEQKREIQAKIKAASQAVKKAESEIEKLDQQLDMILRWKERIQQFYIYLTNTALKAIEDRCNVFLQNIGSDMSIRLDGYRTLSTGKIKDNITAQISRGLKDDLGYRSFSGGERGRLVFATILALQSMVNEESSEGLDLLMIDEVLDQVDAEGMKMFLRSIQNLGRTIFLTSQVRTEADESDILLIRKENGISRIVK